MTRRIRPSWCACACCVAYEVDEVDEAEAAALARRRATFW
jgi:hypothetical protein